MSDYLPLGWNAPLYALLFTTFMFLFHDMAYRDRGDWSYVELGICVADLLFLLIKSVEMLL